MTANDNIPHQHSGASLDVACSKTFSTTQEAANAYDALRNKLLLVYNWQQYAGEALANFTLYGQEGEPVEREAQEKDYFRINIPGPDNPSGDGDDWVRVQQITEERNEGEAFLSIIVRPVACPLNNDRDVAHFFTCEASSTFIIRQKGNEVFAEVHGRNEKPNIKGVAVTDKIRNSLVATGSVFGFSKIQWKNLTDGLINSL